MTTWATYDQATGEIVAVSTGDGAPVLPLPSTYAVLAVAGAVDRLKQYVAAGKLAARKPGTPGAAGAKIRVNGGAAMLESVWTVPDQAGTYLIEYVGAFSGSRTVIVKSRDDLKAEIDAAAGDARKKWLTIVAGQSDAYREKMVDVASLNTLAGTTALILTALNAIPAADQKARWPFLWAEKEARGLATLVLARDAIAAAATASRAARAEIERTRRTGKIAVTNAATLLAANVAARSVVFPA